MSDAAKAAVQQALSEATGFGQRLANVNLDMAQKTIGTTIAQELMKLRGEMTAIRILLSEQGDQRVADSGNDMGNG